MELSEWRDVAEIAQAVAFVLAVLGGATWTILTYGLFRQKARAELELRDLENKSHRQAAVNLSVSASQVTLPLEGGLYLHVEVEAHNVGNRNTLLRLNPEPLSITEVFIREDGAHPVGRWQASILRDAVEWDEADADEDDGQRYDVVVRSGMTMRWSFLVWVPRPGTYHLGFDAWVSQQDLGEARLAGIAREDLVWDTETYAMVRPVGPDGPAPVDAVAPAEETTGAVSLLEVAATNVFRAWWTNVGTGGEEPPDDEAHDDESDPSELAVFLEELKELRLRLLGPERWPAAAVASRLESLLTVTSPAAVEAAGPDVLEDAVAELAAAAQPETV